MKDIEGNITQRNRLIARNEALRQRIGDIRLATWAVLLAIAIAAFFVWMAFFG